MEGNLLLRYLEVAAPGSDEAIRGTAASLMDLASKHANAVTLSAAASSTLHASIAARVTWTGTHKENKAAIAHLLQSALFIMEADESVVFVDWEGMCHGQMFEPADVVFYDCETDVVTLVDFTSNQTSDKRARVDGRAKALKTSFEGVKIEGITMGVSIKPILDESHPRPHSVGGIEGDMVEYTRALRRVKKFENAGPEEVAQVIRDTTAPPNVEPPHNCVEVAMGVASFSERMGVLAEIKKRYPKVYKLMMKQHSSVKGRSFTKGMTLPSEGAPAVTESGVSLGAFLLTASRLEEGTCSALRRGADGVPDMVRCSHAWVGLRESGGEDDLGFIVVAKSLGAGVLEMGYTDAAPSEFIRLVGPREKRGRPDPWVIEVPGSNTALEQQIREEARLAEYSGPSRLAVPSPTDRARALLMMNDSRGAAEETSINVAQNCLAEADSVIAAKMLSLSRIIAQAAAMSCARRGRKHRILVEGHMSDRVVTASRLVGPLTSFTATNVMAWVSKPDTMRPSWWCGMDGPDVGYSKCLLMAKRTIDFLSGAPTKHGVRYASLMDESDNISLSCPRTSAAIALQLISGRKVFGISAFGQRYLSTAASSFSGDMDKVCKKADYHTAMTGVEALLMYRMLERCMAIALLRDGGRMDLIFQDAQDGQRSPMWAPMYLHSGRVNYAGIASGMYDGALSTGTDASAMRAAILSWQAVVDQDRAYARWVSSGNIYARCMSPKTLKALHEGNIEEWVQTKEHHDAEREFIRGLVKQENEYSASIYATVAAARKVKKAQDIRPSRLKSHTQNISKALGTTKAALPEIAKGGKSTDWAFCVNAANIVIDAMGPKANITSSTLANFFQTWESRRSVTLGCIAALSWLQDEDFICEVVPKGGTIEKPRCIGIMAWLARSVIFLCDQLGFEVGLAMRQSAIGSHDKYKEVEAMVKELGVVARGEVIVRGMSDAAGWGPKKNMPVVAAGMDGILGEPLEEEEKATHLQENNVDGCVKMVLKKLRTSANLRKMEGDDHFLLSSEDSEFLKKVVECGLLAHRPGMLNGLMTGVTDVGGALALSVFEESCLLVGIMASGRGTNDDVIFLAKIKAKLVKEWAFKLGEALKAADRLLGINANLGKMILGTTFTEINTWITTQMGYLKPYIRALYGIGGNSGQADYNTSALGAISASDQAVHEGAPMHMAHIGVAYAWVAHYERFRLTQIVFSEGFSGHDALRLGPPIFPGTLSRVYGPVAVAAAYHERRGGGSIKGYAANLIVPVLAAAADACTATEWVTGGTEVDTEEGSVERFSLTCFPTKVEVKDERFDKSILSAMEEGTLAANAYASRDSATSVMRNALKGIQRATKQDPFRATSLIFQSVASSFSLANQRVNVRSTRIRDGAMTLTTSTISHEEFIMALSKEEVAYDIAEGVGGAAKLGPLQEIIIRARTALSVIRSIQATATIYRSPSYLGPIRAPSSGSKRISPEEMCILMASDDLKPVAQYMAMKRGSSPASVLPLVEAPLEDYEKLLAVATAVVEIVASKVSPGMLVGSKGRVNWEMAAFHGYVDKLGLMQKARPSAIVLEVRTDASVSTPTEMACQTAGRLAMLHATVEGISKTFRAPTLTEASLGNVKSSLEVGKRGGEKTTLASTNKSQLTKVYASLCALGAKVQVGRRTMAVMARTKVPAITRGVAHSMTTRACAYYTANAVGSREKVALLSTLVRYYRDFEYQATTYIVIPKGIGRGWQVRDNKTLLSNGDYHKGALVRFLWAKEGHACIHGSPPALMLLVQGVYFPVLEVPSEYAYTGETPRLEVHNAPDVDSKKSWATGMALFFNQRIAYNPSITAALAGLCACVPIGVALLELVMSMSVAITTADPPYVMDGVNLVLEDISSEEPLTDDDASNIINHCLASNILTTMAANKEAFSQGTQSTQSCGTLLGAWRGYFDRASVREVAQDVPSVYALSHGEFSYLTDEPYWPEEWDTASVGDEDSKEDSKSDSDDEKNAMDIPKKTASTAVPFSAAPGPEYVVGRWADVTEETDRAYAEYLKEALGGDWAGDEDEEGEGDEDAALSAALAERMACMAGLGSMDLCDESSDESGDEKSEEEEEVDVGLVSEMEKEEALGGIEEAAGDLALYGVFGKLTAFKMSVEGARRVPLRSDYWKGVAYLSTLHNLLIRDIAACSVDRVAVGGGGLSLLTVEAYRAKDAGDEKALVAAGGVGPLAATMLCGDATFMKALNSARFARLNSLEEAGQPAAFYLSRRGAVPLMASRFRSEDLRMEHMRHADDIERMVLLGDQFTDVSTGTTAGYAFPSISEV